MKWEDVISSMDLATVVSDRKLKGSGLAKGDIVVVVGTEQVPASANDLYLTRMLVNVVKLVDQVMLKDNIYKLDPRSLEKITDDKRIRQLVGD